MPNHPRKWDKSWDPMEECIAFILTQLRRNWSVFSASQINCFWQVLQMFANLLKIAFSLCWIPGFTQMKGKEILRVCQHALLWFDMIMPTLQAFWKFHGLRFSVPLMVFISAGIPPCGRSSWLYMGTYPAVICPFQHCWLTTRVWRRTENPENSKFSYSTNFQIPFKPI